MACCCPGCSSIVGVSKIMVFSSSRAANAKRSFDSVDWAGLEPAFFDRLTQLAADSAETRMPPGVYRCATNPFAGLPASVPPCNLGLRTRLSLREGHISPAVEFPSPSNEQWLSCDAVLACSGLVASCPHA